MLSLPVVTVWIIEWLATTRLGPDDIGRVVNWVIMAQAAAGLCSLGIPLTVSYFVASAIRDGRRPAVGAVVLCALSPSVLVALVWGLSFTSESPQALSYLGAALGAATIAAAVTDSGLMASGQHRRGGVIAVAGALTVALGAALAFPLQLIGQDSLSIWFMGLLIAGPMIRFGCGLVAICVFVGGKDNTGGPLEKRFWSRDLAAFALMAGTLNLLDAVSSWADRLIVLRAFVDQPAELALYRYGAREIPLLSSLIGAISAVLFVRFVLTGATAGLPTASDRAVLEMWRWRKTTAALWAILIPVAALLGIFSTEIFRLVYGQAWGGAASYFCVYLWLLPLRAMPLLGLLQARGMHRTALVGSLTDALLSAGLGALFVLWLGLNPIWAAAAFVFATYVQAAIYIKAIQAGFGASPPWKDLFRAVLSATPLVVLWLVGWKAQIHLVALALVVVALSVWWHLLQLLSASRSQHSPQ